MGLKNFKLPLVWAKIKYWFGYSLFIIAISYGLRHPPPELWEINPAWLFSSALVAVVIFILQVWQVVIFLRYHNIQTEWLLPSLFTARKSVLNTVLPARAGSLMLVTMLTKNYHLKWYAFVKFILIGSLASLLVSLLGVVWLLFPLEYVFLLLLSLLIIVYFSIRHSLFIYASCLPSLFTIALGIYICTVLAFYCMLRGLGFKLGIIDISYFAVALNALAQFSFTPGNVGIREIVVGVIAPYICLPVSVGVLASAVFYIIRLLVYSIFLFLLEWLFKNQAVAAKLPLKPK